MKPITIDISYWGDRPIERVTVPEAETLVEFMKPILFSKETKAIQVTIEKSHEGEHSR